MLDLLTPLLQPRQDNPSQQLLAKFLQDLGDAVAAEFSDTHSVGTGPPSTSAYIAHVLVLCLGMDETLYSRRFAQILAGITARYDCQQATLLGQGNRVLVAVARNQPVDFGREVKDSPLLPAEIWAQNVTWEEGPA